jgi:AcrR family transcriptional regulator
MAKKMYPLRERKHAKTKIALVNAFIEKLKTTRFADISIKEICQSVEVSEGTFYNYFPQKFDVINYFQLLHILKIEWETNQRKDKFGPLELIDLAFDSMAETISQPYLFFEIVSVFTSEHIKPPKGTLTSVEKVYAFPNCNGIEDTSLESLDDFFRRHLREAKKQGEIDKNIDIEDVFIVLKTILIGVPLAIEIEDFGKLAKIYKRQLGLLKKSFAVK